MHTKAVSITVALLTLTIFACSSEPGKTPAAEKNKPATEVSRVVTEKKQPPSLTDKSTNTSTVVSCPTILDSHCTACHHATRICQKLGRKNTKGWKRTIKNMVNHGAQITSAETESLVQCLDQQQQEVREYCQ